MATLRCPILGCLRCVLPHCWCAASHGTGAILSPSPRSAEANPPVYAVVPLGPISSILWAKSHGKEPCWISWSYHTAALVWCLSSEPTHSARAIIQRFLCSERAHFKHSIIQRLGGAAPERLRRVPQLGATICQTVLRHVSGMWRERALPVSVLCPKSVLYAAQTCPTCFLNVS